MRESFKFLLIQIRDEAQTRREEVMSFANYGRIDKSQIDILNVFDTPVFDKNVANKYDGIFIGGSSVVHITEDAHHPFLKSMTDLVQHLMAINKPIFASCFGFQFIVYATKSKTKKMLKNEDDFELGTLDIYTCDSASKDNIFKHLPKVFKAVVGHKVEVHKVPKDFTILAKTARCVHAYKINNKNIWATQFHPELNPETFKLRLGACRDDYTDDLEHFNELMSQAGETPEANNLIGYFVDNLQSINL